MVLLPCLPEEVSSVLHNKLVERVLFTGHFIEWLMSASHAEKDNCESEKIDRLPLVLVSVEDLRCHVHW
jgi:hypothetical protein